MNSIGPLAWLILVLPGIAMLMALRIFYRRQVVTTNFARLALSTTAWLLILMAVLGVAIGSLVWFSLVYLPLTIIAILMLVDRFRRSEHHALLNTIAFAAEKGVPLPDTARAYSLENSGDTGVRAIRLAEMIEAGASLSAATRAARLRLATPMRLAVNLSDVLTARGLTLRSQLNWGSETDASFRTIINRLLYLFIVFLIMSFLVIFMMLKIVPVFQRMFEEFGLKLPGLTELIIQASRFTVNVSPPYLIPLAAVSLFCLFLIVLYYTGWYDFPLVFGSQTNPRYARVPDVFRVMDLVFVRLLFWRYDASLVLRSLALLMKQRLPLPESITLLANVYPRGGVRRRLTLAAVAIEQGVDWKVALRQQWLIGPAEFAVLSAAERAGNLPWAMDEMGEGLMRRLTYRLMVVHQIVYPILLLLFGGVVATFSIGMMLPLISLIQGLT